MFIDYGNFEIVGVHDCRQLNAELLRLAPLAFKCGLTGVSLNTDRYDELKAVLQGAEIVVRAGIV